MAGPDPPSDPPQNPGLARALAADAAFALIVSLLAALVLASLSAAGVITMALARILLATAWLVGVLLVFVAAPLWVTTSRHKVVFAALLAVFLVGVERYEAANQPAAVPPADKPLGIAQDVGIGSLRLLSVTTRMAMNGRSATILVRLKNSSDHFLKYVAHLSSEGRLGSPARTGYIYPGQDIALDYGELVSVLAKEQPGSVMIHPAFRPFVMTLEYSIEYGAPSGPTLEHYTHRRIQIPIVDAPVRTDNGKQDEVEIKASVSDEVER